MAAGQKKRAKKVSKGIHGGGGKGRPLSEVERVNMGDGMVRSFRPIGSPMVEIVKPNVETAKRGMAAVAKASV